MVQLVGQQLGELPISDVPLSIEKPIRDLVLTRILHNGDNTVNLYTEKERGVVRVMANG